MRQREVIFQQDKQQVVTQISVGDIVAGRNINIGNGSVSDDNRYTELRLRLLNTIDAVEARAIELGISLGTHDSDMERGQLTMLEEVLALLYGTAQFPDARIVRARSFMQREIDMALEGLDAAQNARKPHSEE